MRCIGNHKSIVSFHKDSSVTKEHLIDLVNNEGYKAGTARYIANHPNCNHEVFAVMQSHEKWYVRLIGYIHYRRGYQSIYDMQRLLEEGKEDKRLLSYIGKRIIKDWHLMKVNEAELALIQQEIDNVLENTDEDIR